MCGIAVPLSHPTASLLRLKWLMVGGGIGWAPFVKMVNRHQPMSITTMAEVICMMRSAFPLENGIPRRLLCQKYSVTRIANPAADAWDGNRNQEIRKCCPVSLIRPAR